MTDYIINEVELSGITTVPQSWSNLANIEKVVHSRPLSEHDKQMRKKVLDELKKKIDVKESLLNHTCGWRGKRSAFIHVKQLIQSLRTKQEEPK